MTDRDDDRLDTLFAEAKEAHTDLGPDFLARLEADAAEALPEPKVVPFAPRSLSRRLWTGGGLLAAGVAGIAIGLAAPEMLNTILLSEPDAFQLAEVLPSANPALMFGDLE